MRNTLDCNSELVKFELMDRAATLSTMLDQLITGHVGLENGRLQELHDNAEKALEDLYQEAGRIALLLKPPTHES